MTTVELPPTALGDRALSPGDALVRRIRGEHRLDEWGLDEDLVRTLLPAARVRWSIEVAGVAHVPVSGPAVLVYNRRVGVSEPSVLATGVHRATGRVVRHPGVPDVAPLGPALRRLGGVLGRVDEIAGVLRAGHLVGLPLRRELLSRHAAGSPPRSRLEAAVAVGAPIIPVALVGWEAGWRWKVAFGPALEPARRRVPLAADEVAEQAREAVQDLLDEHVPVSWPFG